MKTKKKKEMEKSFKRGYSQVPDFRKVEVRTKIMTVLSIGEYYQWYKRLQGKCNFSLAEREALERIFNEFNIVDIWGKENFQLPS